jgi:receptor-type tyrosine-protein phosphatase N
MILLINSDGVGRTGTFILIDMILNKVVKDTKEIDLAATVEYLRDQRIDMVKTKVNRFILKFILKFKGCNLKILNFI